MNKIILILTIILLSTQTSFAGDYYIVGVDCFNKGLYDKATISLEKAVRISPKNVNARYYLAQSYLMQKRSADAMEQYNRILILSPTSDAARLSQKGLSLIAQSSQGKTSPLADDSGDLSQYKDNYIDYVVANDGTIKKWQKFPVLVYIEPKKGQTASKSAFDEWQNKTGGLIKFNYTNDASSAQIVLTYKDSLESSSTKESHIAGVSKPYYQGNYIIKSEIKILSVDPDTKAAVPDDMIFFSTLHELGHSLGMAGHSPNSADIMYGQASEVKKALTQRDINTINVLYKTSQSTTAKNGSTDVKLQQALDYVKASPDKAIGWANLGDIYRGKKMYTDAIKSYNKAISIEPAKAELYNLVGVSYQLNKDNDNAYNNLKKACDLDKNNQFYLYQFLQLCSSMGKKQEGTAYLKTYIQANPQSVFDPKMQEIMKSF